MPRLSRILASARHPGPAHCLAAAVAAVPEAEWNIAAHPAAAQLLAEAYPEVMAGARVIEVPFAEAQEADHDQIRAGLAFCARLVDAIRPDVALRTTPSTGWGMDELVATAVAGRAPVIALQDFPGLGIALRAGAHPVAVGGVDAALAPDEISAGWLSDRAQAPVTPVGWLAHDRFHRSPPYDRQRAESRREAGIGASELCMLVIGSGPDISLAAEAGLVAEAAAGAGALSPTPVTVEYRLHPRRPAAEASGLAEALRVALAPNARLPAGRLAPGVAGLAAADIVISRASVMNLETMAYAATWHCADPPLSVYVLAGGQFPVAGYWGPGLPATHLPDGGSLVIEAGLGAAISRGMAARRDVGRRALARGYVSDPDRTRAILRPLLTGSPGDRASTAQIILGKNDKTI